MQKRVVPTLRDIQSSLQQAILTGDEAILAHLQDNSRTTRTTLFGVYRNAYTSRLVEVLKTDFPISLTYVGDDAFLDLALAYVRSHPSRTENARWFSAAFPEFVAETGKHPFGPALAELAAIERAVANAFDSRDAPLLTLGDLAKTPPNDWRHLTFTAHPSAALLHNATNAFAIWRCLKEGEACDEEMHLSEAEIVIIWRQGAAPMVRVMSYEEAMMWTEASRGTRFDDLCAMLAAFADPPGAAARAAGYLQIWLMAELLTSDGDA